MTKSVLRISIKRPAEVTVDEKSAWRLCHRQMLTQASPFLSPRFIDFLSERVPGIKIAIFERNELPCAFLAYNEAIPGAALPPGWPANDFQGIIGDPSGFPVEALLSAAGLELLFFDHLIERQAFFSAHHSVNRHSAHVFSLFSSSPETRFHESKNFRANLKKSRGAFKERFGHEPEIRLMLGLNAELDTVLGWKEKHYERSRIMNSVFIHRSASLFQILPWLKDVLRSIISAPSEVLALVLATLSGKDELIAGELLLRTAGWASSWFAGFHPDHGRLSPGILLSTILLQSAGENGINFYDLGYGDELYKQYLSNTRIELVTAVVSSERLRSSPEKAATLLKRALATAADCDLTDSFQGHLDMFVRTSIKST